MTRDELQEYLKCAQDPIYFLNKYGKILNIAKTPVQLDDLECFPYQEDILRKFQKHQNNIVLKSRQTGLSVITAGFVVWTTLFKIDQKVLIVANDRNGAVRFLSTVKQYLDYLPAFLLPSSREKDNESEIIFSNKNSVKAVAAGKNAGRGETPSLLILDETAFIENADSIWTAASLSLSGTKGKCIMISTPFGKGNLYYNTWTAAVEGKGDFVPTEIHWTEHPVYNKGKELKMDEFGRTYWTSPWYEYQCEQLQHDRVKIAQELDLSFEGSRALVIDSHIIQKHKDQIKATERPPYFFNFRAEGSGFTDLKTDFWVWKKPVPNANYIVSCDVGRGDGADYSTIQVIKAVGDLEQVAEYQGKIAPDLFASIIYKVAMEYNKAYVVIECNSFGLATSLTLKNQLRYDPRRIHHSKSVKKLVNHHFGVQADEESEIPGFQTTQQSRILIIAALTSYLRDSKIKLNSIRLMNEFDHFIYDGVKATHEKGKHDDLIIALGIGLMIRDKEFESVFLSKEFYKSMIQAITYSNSKNPDEGLKIKEDEFKAKAQEQYKMPDISRTSSTNDDDLRWLLGDINTRE